MTDVTDLESLVAARVRPYKWLAVAIVIGLLMLAAYLFGARTSAPVAENTSPAAAQSQADGSVVLGRTPSDSAPEAAKPKAVLPKGSTLERQISVTVKPSKTIHVAPSATASDVQCPDVKVDLSLVKDGDGRRVVASSPDGTVVGGIDVPVVEAVTPAEHPWAAGLSCDPAKCKDTVGVWIDRDLARIRVGAEVAKKETGAAEARVRLGWRW